MAGKKEFKSNRDRYLSSVLSRSFEEDRERANSTMKKTLKRVAPNSPLEQNEKELRQQRFLKRWALLIAHGFVKIDGQDARVLDKKMSIAQIMGCGARMSIITGGDNRIIHWLLNKDPVLQNPDDYKQRAHTTNPNILDKSKKEEEDQIVRIRAGATHGFKGDAEIKTKNPFIALRRDGRHLGVDIAVGGPDEKDIHGREISMDGLSGHAYIHVDPKSGNILIGMENCREPKMLGEMVAEGQFGIHSKMGSPEPITALGTAPFAKSRYQEWGFTRKRYDCIKVNLKRKMADNLVSLNPDNFSDDLVEAFPCRNDQEIQEFNQKYSSLYRNPDQIESEEGPDSEEETLTPRTTSSDDTQDQPHQPLAARVRSSSSPLPSSSNSFIDEKRIISIFNATSLNPDLLKRTEIKNALAPFLDRKNYLEKALKKEKLKVNHQYFSRPEDFYRPNKYSGIGAEVSFKREGEYWVFSVEKVFPGGACHANGIETGCKILVNSDYDLDTIVANIRDYGISANDENMVVLDKNNHKMDIEKDLSTVIFEKKENKMVPYGESEIDKLLHPRRNLARQRGHSFTGSSGTSHSR